MNSIYKPEEFDDRCPSCGKPLGGFPTTTIYTPLLKDDYAGMFYGHGHSDTKEVPVEVKCGNCGVVSIWKDCEEWGVEETTTTVPIRCLEASLPVDWHYDISSNLPEYDDEVLSTKIVETKSVVTYIPQCPKCRQNLEEDKEFDFCCHCGQKLLWTKKPSLKVNIFVRKYLPIRYESLFGDR